MNKAQVLAKACQVLRSRVRYKTARLGTMEADLTPEIREQTKLYVETWIVPIIDMIERGDTRALGEFCFGDQGDEMESPK